MSALEKKQSFIFGQYTLNPFIPPPRSEEDQKRNTMPGIYISYSGDRDFEDGGSRPAQGKC
jgi:hypothetical protein